MNRALLALIKRFGDVEFSKARVIPWSCPVPSFGDPFTANVATLGLNPSNREFVDRSGNELVGEARRFHTLRSLGLSHWSEATPEHAELIWNSCRTYFSGNPYKFWFNRLDYVIGATGASYDGATACHLDLIPYATACKWTALTTLQRAFLFSIAGDTLGVMLRDSSIRLLVLNGRSVVVNFERVAGVELGQRVMKEWEIPRGSPPNVAGIAFKGVISRISGVSLKRKLLVVGFNHNIQGSFGISCAINASIRSWIGKTAAESGSERES